VFQIGFTTPTIFFWIFPNCLSIFLGQNLEFGFILFWKFLSRGAHRSAALSPSLRSYWLSGAALPDAVGVGIKPSSRPAVRSRPSLRLTCRPDSPGSDASPTSPSCPSDALPPAVRSRVPPPLFELTAVPPGKLLRRRFFSEPPLHSLSSATA
jgi:hypothetical protein